MPTRTKILIVGACVVAVAAVVPTVAIATADSEAAITGEALQRASQAALAHTGGGTVTDTEVGDEESMYEVEVTLNDGTQVDVQLDEEFEVVASTPDDELDDEGD